MTLPDQPPTFRPESPAARPWWWRLLGPAGDAVTVEGDLAERRFASQADAESWVGEFWPELAALGVASVTLQEAGRTVYGPMSLSA